MLGSDRDRWISNRCQRTSLWRHGASIFGSVSFFSSHMCSFGSALSSILILNVHAQPCGVCVKVLYSNMFQKLHRAGSVLRSRRTSVSGWIWKVLSQTFLNDSSLRSDLRSVHLKKKSANMQYLSLLPLVILYDNHQAIIIYIQSVLLHEIVCEMSENGKNDDFLKPKQMFFCLTNSRKASNLQSWQTEMFVVISRPSIWAIALIMTVR